MGSEINPEARKCFQKERENRVNLSVATSHDGSTTSFAAIPVVSEECDPSCTGEIRETRHIGGFALPQFCDKRICPMQLKKQ